LGTGLTEAGTVRAAAAAGLSLNTGMEPGYGLLGGAMGLSAAALTRFAALTSGTSEPDALNLEDAAGAPAGSGGLLALPGLTGERAPYWHQEIGGGLYGLRLDHGRSHILRAVMEAGAYRLRAVLDRLRSLGLSPARLLISGGGAGSAVWNRIRADVCGLPVERARSAEATCLGAAMFARRALDPALSLAAISGEWIGTRDRWEPDRGQEAVYAPARRRFEGLLAALARFEEEP
jgi:sugar (pentulose or hexulose) kinase